MEFLKKDFSLNKASVAQLVERLICNQRVRGSIPFGGFKVLRRGSRVAKGDGL